MSKSSPGIGRGGRGAALLAALQAQQRRPGQEAGSSSSPQPTGIAAPAPAPTIPSGRAAMLAALLTKMQSTGGGDARSVGTPPPGAQSASKVPVRPPMGRAALLQQAVSKGKQPQARPGAEEKIQHSDREVPTQKLSEMSLHQRSPVTEKGTSGKEIKLTTNYIKLHVKHGKGVYEYEVQFHPPVDSKVMRLRMLRQHVEVFGRARTFDGAKLYLPFELEKTKTELECILPSDESPVTMYVNLKHKKQMGDCIHLYNVLFRRIMGILMMVPMGRNYYSPKNAVMIPQHKLEVWPGYVTAVSEVEGGIMLCCDVSHRVLMRQTVYDVMVNILRRSPRNYQDLVVKSVVGCSVLTRYNNKTYRIDDIDWKQSPRSTFLNHVGEEISYLQYYRKNYEITITNDEQPMLVHRVNVKGQQGQDSTRLICLVPELCYLTGLNDSMRKDYKVMKDIAMYTRITPEKRLEAYRNFVENILGNEQARSVLEDWGLWMDSDALQLQGRVLENEKIIMKNSVFPNDRGDWGNFVTRNKSLVTVDLRQWVVVYTDRDEKKVGDFVAMMMRVAPEMGIKVQHPMKVLLQDDRNETLIRQLERSINPAVQCVVVIARTQREDRYSAIKKLCCREKPVPSQVINSGTISRPEKLRPIVQKIALQINCKLGGELWAVQMPFKNTMVCGIDVYHDAAGSRAVAGFVASLNVSMTRWFSNSCFQGHGHELVNGLKVCFIASLKKYWDVNSMYPDHVIIFRDGVSDGELNTVRKHEVEQLATAFSCFDNYNPDLTVVVVQKRINTRIFTHLNDRQLENPPSGTVLDHTVTRANWYDFFLVSQLVRQGTVTPTHYVVVYDSGNVKPDLIQKFAYKLTHMYYNWPGTIRVPAPCQYAHKLAQLVGQNIHKDASAKLSDRLFYL